MTRAPLSPELVEQRLSELQQLSRLGASLAEAELPPIDRRILERRSLRIVGRAPGHGVDARDVRLHVPTRGFRYSCLVSLAASNARHSAYVIRAIATGTIRPV